MGESIVPENTATSHAAKRGAAHVLEIMKVPIATLSALLKHKSMGELPA
jgi:hypothetical protein